MDPNACLASFWEALQQSHRTDALEHATNLANWLRAGGFPPNWNLNGYSLTEYRAALLGLYATRGEKGARAARFALAEVLPSRWEHE